MTRACEGRGGHSLTFDDITVGAAVADIRTWRKTNNLYGGGEKNMATDDRNTQRSILVK